MLVHQIIMILMGICCGSVLFGSFFPRAFKNIDVAALSSDHNPGAANAIKYAGVPVGMLCLAGDIFKGAAPVHLAMRMGLAAESLFPLVMAAPVFGHAYSLFHHGKGGKAIAVSFGVMIGIAPIHPHLLALLCALYLLGSLVFVIKPHTKRTRVTFFCFGLGAAVFAALGWIPATVCCGALLIAGIVVHKNSVRQQLTETLQNV